MFTYTVKRETGHFYVVVVQCRFDVLVPDAVVGFEGPLSLESWNASVCLFTFSISHSSRIKHESGVSKRLSTEGRVQFVLTWCYSALVQQHHLATVNGTESSPISNGNLVICDNNISYLKTKKEESHTVNHPLLNTNPCLLGNNCRLAILREIPRSIVHDGSIIVWCTQRVHAAWFPEVSLFSY